MNAGQYDNFNKQVQTNPYDGTIDEVFISDHSFYPTIHIDRFFPAKVLV